MEKNLKDYLHLYLGCDVMFSGEAYTLYEVIHKHSNCGIRDKQLKNVPAPINFIKPILRRLEDMNYEEAFDFALMCMNSQHHLDEESKITNEELHDVELAKNDGGNLLDTDIEIFIGISIRCFEGAVIIKKDGSIYVRDEGNEMENHIDDIAYKVKWLIDKGFDLFGLIDAGLAIDKSTLT